MYSKLMTQSIMQGSRTERKTVRYCRTSHSGKGVQMPFSPFQDTTIALTTRSSVAILFVYQGRVMNFLSHH